MSTLSAHHHTPHTVSPTALRWQDDATLHVDGVEFRLLTSPADLNAASSRPDSFVLGKTRRMVDTLVEEAPAGVRAVVDLGIFHGGSAVLTEKLFRPEVIVAVDVQTEPSAALEHYLDANGLRDVIRTLWGTRQDDGGTLSRVLTERVGPAGLDLIVDDCSHAYEASRSSFELLFPWLRPGGLYVLEDWGWAHWPGDLWQGEDAYFAGMPFLSNLVFEWTMLAASRPELVERLIVEPSAAYLRRGSGALPTGPFSLSDAYLTRGVPFRAMI